MKVSSLYYHKSNKPHVVKLRIRADTQFLTEAKEDEPHKILFAIAGTSYGYKHRTSGDIQFWKSESGARKALHKYKSI